ncbi:hypothetical protein E4U21_002903 [Claviceps maximensis]|nr:hypothetical protein E4U21_002903 [Claviceps maximensis]
MTFVVEKSAEITSGMDVEAVLASLCCHDELICQEKAQRIEGSRTDKAIASSQSVQSGSLDQSSLAPATHEQQAGRGPGQVGQAVRKALGAPGPGAEPGPGPGAGASGFTGWWSGHGP